MRVVVFELHKDNTLLVRDRKDLKLTPSGKFHGSSKTSVIMSASKVVSSSRRTRSVDKVKLDQYLTDVLSTLNDYNGKMGVVNLDRVLNDNVKCTFTIGKL